MPTMPLHWLGARGRHTITVRSAEGSFTSVSWAYTTPWPKDVTCPLCIQEIVKMSIAERRSIVFDCTADEVRRAELVLEEMRKTAEEARELGVGDIRLEVSSARAATAAKVAG